MITHSLMLALLSLDSYNRGSFSELKWSDAHSGTAPGQDAPTKLGDAILISTLDHETQSKKAFEKTLGTAPEEARNGFYAAAYQLGDRKIIAIRGTDNLDDDFPNGYTIAAGYPGQISGPVKWAAEQAGYVFNQTPQSYDAIRFYQQIVGNADLKSNNVDVTGHSMGGGIAGLVNAVYGKAGTVFDHMPFEKAASWAKRLAEGYQDVFVDEMGNSTLVDVPPDEAWKQLVYGNASPWESSVTNLKGIFIPNSGVSYGNVVQIARALTPGTTIETTKLELPDGVGLLKTTSANQFGPRHDGALIVIRLYADEKKADGGRVVDGAWEKSAQYWMKHLFDGDIAKAVGAERYAGQRQGINALALPMRDAIAYSVVDPSGAADTKPFGDAAVRALYDDAVQFGKVMDASSVNPILNAKLYSYALLSTDSVADAIGKIMVQFSGDVALAKSTKEVDRLGVFEAPTDAKKLLIDLDPEKWRVTFNKHVAEDWAKANKGQTNQRIGDSQL